MADRNVCPLDPANASRTAPIGLLASLAVVSPPPRLKIFLTLCYLRVRVCVARPYDFIQTPPACDMNIS